MAWSKGQPWRVVRSLERLNAQIRAAYPRAVPPATPASSWGSIADSAHSSTSDHYPHYYSVLGSTAVVCARDFPHAPALGLDAHALADRLRQSRDSRIGYLISNGRITGPGHGWRWDLYSGSDPHDTHIHVSSVHTAAADDARDWKIGDNDMLTTGQDTALSIAWEVADALRDGQDVTEARKSPVWAVRQLRKADAIQADLAALRAQLADLAGRDLVDEDAIVRGVLAGLDPVALAERIAAALPVEQARRVADELAARLAE